MQEKETINQHAAITTAANLKKKKELKNNY